MSDIERPGKPLPKGSPPSESAEKRLRHIKRVSIASGSIGGVPSDSLGVLHPGSVPEKGERNGHVPRPQGWGSGAGISTGEKLPFRGRHPL